MRRMSGRSRDPLVRALVSALDARRVQTGDGARRLYSRDASVMRGGRAGVVCFPETTEEVSACVVAAIAHGRDFVARGAGTGLSGGALPLADGVTVGLAKFNRILDIDYGNRTATVQTGVTNLAITQAVEAKGFYYAPDPSSQIACTIGGNVAENSGGVHCLKYGLTTNNLLGLEMVLMTGGHMVSMPE